MNAAVDKIVSHLGLLPRESVIGRERIVTKDKNQCILMVSLKNRESLDLILSEARKQRPKNGIIGGDENLKIYVNEKLPTAVYNLLKEAKILKKHGYKFVCSRHGKVFAKMKDGDHTSHIKTTRDVTALKQTSSDGGAAAN